MGKLLDAFEKTINGALEGTKQAFNNIGTALGNAWENVEAFGHKAENNLIEGIKQYIEPVKKAGDAVSQKLENGVSEMLGIGNEQQPQIQDTTQSGIENAINGTDIMQFMEEQQAKQWEREDKIRAEVEAREDSAMQRAVRDAQLAGINPNLMNIQPAASGGGITSATGLEYQTYQAEMKEYLTLIEQEIENEFKGNENKKDRWNQLLSSLIMAMIMKR